MTARLSTVWIDAGGRTAAHLITSAVSGVSLQAALAAKSNAVPQMFWEGPLFVPGSAAVAAPFPDVSDIAWLTFTKASGQLLKVALPAPVASIFQADGETVDPTQIAAIIAAALAVLTDPAGNPAIAYVSGLRNVPG